MPGADIGRFVHPLRTADWWDLAALAGLPVIDVYRDIVELEYKSSLPAEDPNPARRRPPEIEADLFLDPEAAFVRSRDDPAAPDDPDRQRLSPVDLTWAFNQATGARPEDRELPVHDNADDPSDPLNGQRVGRDIFTGELVFPINPRLPSLNRQPGIILVPVGLFHIFGTITLFGGQQLIGVAPTPNGSVLVKVGDGACIRTQHAMDFGSDRHRTPEAAKDRLHDGGVNRRAPMERILERLDQNYQSWWARPGEQPEGQPAPPPDEDAERRRLEIVKQVLAGEAFGSANVRISGLRICQLDTDHRRAREPVEDALGDLTESRASTWELRDLRELPIEYSSFGLDLRGPSFAIVEDLHIEGFCCGVGIHIRPRTPTSGSQTTYYNQVRRCVVDGCHRGILAQFTLGICFGDQCGLEGSADTDPAGGSDEEEQQRQQGAQPSDVRALRTADRLSAGRNAANSTVIMDCRVRNFVRSGIEVWGPTFWIFFCTVQARAGQPEATCIVLPLRRCVVYRCRLLSDGRHILLPPGQFVDRDVDPEFPLHVERLPKEASDNIALLQSIFQSSEGVEAAPRIEVLELERRPLRRKEVEAEVGEAELERRRAYEGRRSFRDAWDISGGFRFTKSIPLDVTGTVLRPQTSWTSDNLVTNSRFLEVARCRNGFDAPFGWQVETVARKDVPPGHPLPAFVTHGVEPVDPLFRGNVMQTRFPAAAAQNGATGFRLVQDVVAPDGGSSAGWRGIWARRSVLRGKRLVAACWVRANHVDAVRIAFEEESGAGRVQRPSRTNWRVDDWLLLTTVVDLPGNDSEYMAGGQGKGLWLVVEVVPPAAAVDSAVEVLVGAPQINLGPDLFPVGPMRPGTLTFDGRLLAPLQLRRGIVEEVPIRLEEGQARAAALFGTDAMLESIHADAGDGAGRFVLEHVSGGEVRPLVAWSSDGCGCAGPALAGDVALRRGDRVRVRRLEGAAAMTVHLQTVHSKVV